MRILLIGLIFLSSCSNKVFKKNDCIKFNSTNYFKILQVGHSNYLVEETSIGRSFYGPLSKKAKLTEINIDTSYLFYKVNCTTGE